MPGAKIERVLIIGASLAGLRVCEGLRRHGYEGNISVVGAEPHLPYDRPPLSKHFLSGEYDEGRIALMPPEKLAALNIDFRIGTRASALSLSAREVTCSNGDVLGYDRLVIATGATPRRLPGLETMDGVMVVRTLEDSVALRNRITKDNCRLAIVGGGFLGMEVAATAQKHGASVTVIEPLEAPLARVLGASIGNALAAEHTAHGVNIITGVGVSGVSESAHGIRVELADDTSLEADTVVVAIGVVPETAWLEGSGLTLDNGIVCDPSLRAGPDVFAAGDVCRFPLDLVGGLVRIEHWTNAAEQGNHVASAMLAKEDEVPVFSSVPYFWSDHFDLKIQALGLPGPNDDVAVVDGSLESRQFVACYGRAGKLVGVVAFRRPRQLMAFRRLFVEGASFDDALRLEFA